MAIYPAKSNTTNPLPAEMSAGNYKLKSLKSEYEAFMWELLYQNIFVARRFELAEREMDELPTLKKYIEDWGSRQNDCGFVAIDANNQPIGAVWARTFSAQDQVWGYVDQDTPELNIAVLETHRNQGVGDALLTAMLDKLKKRFVRVSLSVNPKNKSVNLYKRHGFSVHHSYENAVTMIKQL